MDISFVLVFRLYECGTMVGIFVLSSCVHRCYYYYYIITIITRIINCLHTPLTLMCDTQQGPPAPEQIFPHQPTVQIKTHAPKPEEYVVPDTATPWVAHLNEAKVDVQPPSPE